MGSPPVHALAEEIRAHYSGYFGCPHSRLEIAPRSEGPTATGLEVYEYVPQSSGLRLFITVGLSLLNRQTPIPELFFAIRRVGRAVDEVSIRRTLMTFWLAAHRSPELFVSGRILKALGALPEPIEHVVLSPAILLPKGAPKRTLSDGRMLWLAWLVPVIGWEVDYVRRGGPLDLLAYFRREGIDPTIVDRALGDDSSENLPTEPGRPPDEAKVASRARTVLGGRKSPNPSSRPASARGARRSDGEDLYLPNGTARF